LFKKHDKASVIYHLFINEHIPTKEEYDGMFKTSTLKIQNVQGDLNLKAFEYVDISSFISRYSILLNFHSHLLPRQHTQGETAGFQLGGKLGADSGKHSGFPARWEDGGGLMARLQVLARSMERGQTHSQTILLAAHIFL
jgi:hypothetical protein